MPGADGLLAELLRRGLGAAVDLAVDDAVKVARDEPDPQLPEQGDDHDRESQAEPAPGPPGPAFPFRR